MHAVLICVMDACTAVVMCVMDACMQVLQLSDQGQNGGKSQLFGMLNSSVLAQMQSAK
jgi:hypothetical protein